MIIRFVQGSGYFSRLIILQEKTAMPFTPSHVEAIMPDGTWLGAHFDGGVQARPAGYDAASVAHELQLPLPATQEQDAAFHLFLHNHIGEPYDWRAIIGFVSAQHEHIAEHTICSALIVLALRAARWFASPLAAPAHLISPRDLLLVLSGRLTVPM